MTVKKLTLLLVALLCVSAVSAQQSKTDERVEFRPHWDLQLQGGIGYTLGESSSFGDLMSPAVALSTNYRFHHAMGVRFGFAGLQGRGVVVSPMSKYAFNYVQLNADYKLDLTALFGGYNHRRPVSVYLLAGAGFNYGFNNGEAAAIAAGLPTWSQPLEYLWDSKFFVAGRMGAGIDFRVGEYVTLNLEGNANVMSDHFNSKKAENADWQFNILAGVSVSFGKKHRESKVWAAEQEALKRAEEARLEQERLAEEARKAEEARQAEVARLAAVRAANIEAHSQDVFFAIGSATVRKSEMEKINSLAKWLVENADYSVAVVGYADKETGTAVGNLKLSERRAENVKKALVQAGVDASRIELGHKGDTEQPFAKASENRVVICTLE